MSSSSQAVVAESEVRLIEQYLDAVWMERGLSENTLASYRRDLMQYAGWLQTRGHRLLGAGKEELQRHLAWRFAERVKASSTARLLSSLRGFYRYLVREKLIETDPTLLIESPKKGRSLPKTLTESDVESLLQAPDIGDPGRVARSGYAGVALRNWIACNRAGHPAEFAGESAPGCYPGNG